MFGAFFGTEMRDAAGVGVGRGGDRFLDHLGRLVNAALHGRVDDGLAGEALLAADIDVYREDHRVSSGNDSRVQRGESARALGFNLQVHACFLGRGHKGVGCHVGVGDAGGAGRDGDDALRGHGRRSGTGRNRSGLGVERCGPCRVSSRLVGQGSLNQVHDVLPADSCAQGRSEVLLDEGTGQLGEQLQVLLVRSFRGGDEEDDVCGAVLGAEVHLRVRGGPSPGWARLRRSERQCGIAMPPGTPVAVFCSRAKASAKSPSTSEARPAAATLPARKRMTSAGESPRFWSSATSWGVMSWVTVSPSEGP